MIDVVIPTLDERDWIAGTLEALFAGAAGTGVALDVVVVDGGSRDGTPELACAHGARVVQSAPGRAQQLQAGLEATAGDVVVFVHADTCLPRAWAEPLLRAVARPGVVGGAFDFAFERDPGAPLSLAIVEWGTRLRSRWLGLPYGDQALFALRSELDAIGGVPQASLMEDLDLVARLRRRGRLTQLAERVRTSPRRHLEGGVWRVALRHAVAGIGWRIGAPRARLREWLGR
jgi:rSAM/selenodomain-associated transferase 2